MKTIFKPLAISAAVAAVAAGYTSAVSAQEVSSRNVGDLALIPYYGVQNGFATAVHIINTSDVTQVVKLRARRGFDSMDSLDFNIVMSPKDAWVGSLAEEDDGQIAFTTRDVSCTAPATTDVGNGVHKFYMPDQDSVDTLVDFREGAEEGYIEIIAMGQPDSESAAIAVAALHVAGVPRDCAAVRSNFFRGGSASAKGVESNSNTWQTIPTGGLVENVYVDSQNDALKVSWAVTDSSSGLEVGSNAVHVEGFAEAPMITNQQTIVLGESDRLGYLFPDLDGGSPGEGNRGRFEGLRAILGAATVQNDWSSRSTDAFDVAADWVVTMPGQYLMVDPIQYVYSLYDTESPLWKDCPYSSSALLCDNRDIPVTLGITYYDREEGQFTPEEGGLVVSPSVNVTPEGIVLPYETNVIYWKVDADSVLGSQYAVAFSPLFEQDRGWSELQVSSAPNKTQGIYNHETDSFDATSSAVPIIGFAAWERSFENNPNANYGRAVDHSYSISSAD